MTEVRLQVCYEDRCRAAGIYDKVEPLDGTEIDGKTIKVERTGCLNGCGLSGRVNLHCEGQRTVKYGLTGVQSEYFKVLPLGEDPVKTITNAISNL